MSTKNELHFLSFWVLWNDYVCAKLKGGKFTCLWLKGEMEEEIQETLEQTNVDLSRNRER